MSRLTQFPDDTRTFLHNQSTGDNRKPASGSDVIDSEDGDDGSDVIDSDNSDDGGNLDGGRQMKRLPGFVSKTEIVPILGEVVPIKSE